MIRAVADLPAALSGRLQGRDLVVFDGECVLCSWFFRYMWRFDRKARFAYALAQSDVGGQLYATLGLPTDEFETYLVIVDGQIYQKLDAFAAAMQALGGWHRILGLVRFMPRWIKDPIYMTVARNRYRIFGRRDTCMMPDAQLKARFIAGGSA